MQGPGLSLSVANAQPSGLQNKDVCSAPVRGVGFSLEHGGWTFLCEQGLHKWQTAKGCCFLLGNLFLGKHIHTRTHTHTHRKNKTTTTTTKNQVLILWNEYELNKILNFFEHNWCDFILVSGTDWSLCSPGYQHGA